MRHIVYRHIVLVKLRKASLSDLTVYGIVYRLSLSQAGKYTNARDFKVLTLLFCKIETSG